MSDRLKQINEQLRAELASSISQIGVMSDGLITVSEVKCSPNLKNATVIVSVLPERKSGSALRALRSQSSQITRALNKLNLKFIPRINWKIDSQARFAAEIDKVFNEMDDLEQ